MRVSRLPVVVRSTLALAAFVPLLASFLVLGGCSDGRNGFTMILHLFGVSVTASYCHL
jgi:hypothetical protein